MSDFTRSSDEDGSSRYVYKGKISELYNYSTLWRNLLVLIVCWCTCSVGYYVLAIILKYLSGSLFLNLYSSGFGEIAGKLSAIPLLRCASLRMVFMIAFSFASLGLLLLIILQNYENITPVLVLLTRYSFSMGYVASYLSIVLLYPAILASTAGGICVLVSKSVTIFAPMVAEMRSPINLVTVLCISVVATFTSHFLRVEDESKNDDDDDRDKGTASE